MSGRIFLSSRQAGNEKRTGKFSPLMHHSAAAAAAAQEIWYDLEKKLMLLLLLLLSTSSTSLSEFFFELVNRPDKHKAFPKQWQINPLRNARLRPSQCEGIFREWFWHTWWKLSFESHILACSIAWPAAAALLFISWKTSIWGQPAVAINLLPNEQKYFCFRLIPS